MPAEYTPGGGSAPGAVWLSRTRPGYPARRRKTHNAAGAPPQGRTRPEYRPAGQTGRAPPPDRCGCSRRRSGGGRGPARRIAHPPPEKRRRRAAPPETDSAAPEQRRWSPPRGRRPGPCGTRRTAGHSPTGGCKRRGAAAIRAPASTPAPRPAERGYPPPDAERPSHRHTGAAADASSLPPARRRTWPGGRGQAPSRQRSR